MLEGLGQCSGALGRQWLFGTRWRGGEGESSGETSEPQSRASDQEEAQFYFCVDQGWLFFQVWPRQAGIPARCVGSQGLTLPCRAVPVQAGQEGWAFSTCSPHEVSALAREGAYPWCCPRRTPGSPSMLNHELLPQALPVFSWGTEAEILT